MKAGDGAGEKTDRASLQQGVGPRKWPPSSFGFGICMDLPCTCRSAASGKDLQTRVRTFVDISRFSARCRRDERRAASVLAESVAVGVRQHSPAPVRGVQGRGAPQTTSPAVTAPITFAAPLHPADPRPAASFFTTRDASSLIETPRPCPSFSTVPLWGLTIPRSTNETVV